jgi:DNA-binding MarR family transcriptional regulator/N-acetylglutamate synthase-like GNAT family acetyltransferase
MVDKSTQLLDIGNDTCLDPFPLPHALPAPDPAIIRAVRQFNRFYTRRIGVLEESLDQSPFSLPEARVLFELAQGDQVTAVAIADRLGLDPGYLSRLVSSLQRRRLVQRVTSPADGRHRLLSLTREGKAAFRRLEAGTVANLGRMLTPLAIEGRHQLVQSMARIEALLDPAPASAPVLLRDHQPGDMGWIVEAHGALYAREYQWDGGFEALVAEIVAKFLKTFEPKRERCWIAERAGVRVGSVMVVRRSEQIAQLRLLLVDPATRGLGIGRRLVQECIRFASSAGYRRMRLWTNDVLHSARRIYEAEGFELIERERHHSFGHDLVSQTWERSL